MTVLRGRLLVAPALLVAAGVVLGMSLPAVLAVALAVLAVLVLVRCVRRAPDARTSLPPPMDRERDGSRRELAEVSWSLTGSGRAVSEKALRELRPTARLRLRRLGIDWDDPVGAERARELLGERAWTTLTCPGGTLPRLPDIEHTVSVLESLAPGEPLRTSSRFWSRS